MPAYGTIIQANGYFSGRLFTEPWSNADEPTKQKALDHATRMIDRQTFRGRKTDLVQLNQFPRDGETVIPPAIAEACFEEAIALLDRGNSSRRKLQQSGVIHANMADVTEIYAPGSGRGLVSQDARELLRPWLAGAVNIT